MARLHARPLDRGKPLWEMYVIEGLDGVEGMPPGSFALFTKVHHAAIDGVSGIEMTAALHDLTPDGHATPPEHEWIAESPPSVVELALRSTVNNVRQPFRFLQILGKAAPPAIRAAARAAGAYQADATTRRTRCRVPASTGRSRPTASSRRARSGSPT